MDTLSFPSKPQALEVLRQFRVIYGSMRRHFRAVEERCGVSGSQAWILREVQLRPGIGISELAESMGIHQSTCSLLVDKLALRGRLEKQRHPEDLRRVGLQLTVEGASILSALPGPAEGVLPDALKQLSAAGLQALHQQLAELILHLPASDEGFADMPLADLARPDPQGTL
ncbi:MAG: winged helix-turn-helix transcriptional regulator [Betaproteobacteria bacterium]|uniref:Winged helix-turn-helix transcriptional regulator n=1 Tax=Candidatus Proximibacter danicus TaxID=2954365 RepID=A0A9D7PPN5_9PROT|nr:winged helix-turn-helix transcriptional regulator [Candidatus Proximibacter danicus]